MKRAVLSVTPVDTASAEALELSIANFQFTNMAHKNQSELLSELDNLKQRIRVGDRYFHYKHPDHLYHIVALGFIEVTETPAVVYTAEYGDKLTWVRTAEEFFAKVDLEDDKKVDRFTKVG